MIGYPGKFEGELYATRYVYELAGEGFLESMGSVDELGWFACYSGMVRGRGPFHVIISEDEYGFVHGQYFPCEQSMQIAWKELETAYEAYYKQLETA